MAHCASITPTEPKTQTSCECHQLRAELAQVKIELNNLHKLMDEGMKAKVQEANELKSEVSHLSTENKRLKEDLGSQVRKLSVQNSRLSEDITLWKEHVESLEKENEWEPYQESGDEEDPNMCMTREPRKFKLIGRKDWIPGWKKPVNAS